MEDKDLKKDPETGQASSETASDGAENPDTEAATETPELPEEEENQEEKKDENNKKTKKDPKDEQIEALTDKLKRSLAEFDNFRNRTEKEKSAMYEIGARSVIEKMLPIVDNFERGLATIPEDAKGTPFADGMEKVYKQLVKTLDELDVKPIEAVGKEFNPDYHNAVMHVEDENLGENVVAAELQKGYTYRDTVIRHSMVQVAN